MSHETSSTTSPKYGLGTIIIHPQFGRGRIAGYEENSYVIIFKGGETKRVAFFYDEMEIVESSGDPQVDIVKQAVREVLRDYGWIEADIEMGTRWAGGSMELIPGHTDTQSKQIPIEAFFKKIIGLRDKLRVLEQKINTNKSLPPEDKLEMQGYITRCYGSLTTFNVLFASKAGQFKGAGKIDSDHSAEE